MAKTPKYMQQMLTVCNITIEPFQSRNQTKNRTFANEVSIVKAIEATNLWHSNLLVIEMSVLLSKKIKVKHKSRFLRSGFSSEPYSTFIEPVYKGFEKIGFYSMLETIC